MEYFEDLVFLINTLGYGLGFLYGVFAQKNQFCVSGSIKDYILFKNTRRFSSFLMAIIFAIISTQLYSYIYEIDLSKSIYLNSEINLIPIIMGGIIFGYGMIKADGCGNRQLIRLAQGDTKALLVLVFMGIFAFIATKGLLVYPIDVITNTFKLNINFALNDIFDMPSYVMSILVVLVLFFIFTRISKHFMSSLDGVFIGIIIGTAWFVTGYIGFDEFEPTQLESFSFVYPVADSLNYAMYYSGSALSFSVAIVLGVLSGSFFLARATKSDIINCANFQSVSNFKEALIGSSLMGIGGTMAIGCTIGQGLSGVSTLAFASIVAIVSMLLSAYYTAYRMNKNKKLTSGCKTFDWPSI